MFDETPKGPFVKGVLGFGTPMHRISFKCELPQIIAAIPFSKYAQMHVILSFLIRLCMVKCLPRLGQSVDLSQWQNKSLLFSQT